MKQEKSNIKSEDILEILIPLSTIINGLSAERKKAILKELPIKIESSFDETKIYQTLVKYYDEVQDPHFIIELTRRIQNSHSFYRDVGTALDRVKLLNKRQRNNGK